MSVRLIIDSEKILAHEALASWWWRKVSISFEHHVHNTHSRKSLKLKKRYVFCCELLFSFYWQLATESSVCIRDNERRVKCTNDDRKDAYLESTRCLSKNRISQDNTLYDLKFFSTLIAEQTTDNVTSNSNVYLVTERILTQSSSLSVEQNQCSESCSSTHVNQFADTKSTQNAINSQVTQSLSLSVEQNRCSESYSSIYSNQFEDTKLKQNAINSQVNQSSSLSVEQNLYSELYSTIYVSSFVDAKLTQNVNSQVIEVSSSSTDLSYSEVVDYSSCDSFLFRLSNDFCRDLQRRFLWEAWDWETDVMKASYASSTRSWVKTIDLITCILFTHYRSMNHQRTSSSTMTCSALWLQNFLDVWDDVLSLLFKLFFSRRVQFFWVMMTRLKDFRSNQYVKNSTSRDSNEPR